MLLEFHSSERIKFRETAPQLWNRDIQNIIYFHQNQSQFMVQGLLDGTCQFHKILSQDAWPANFCPCPDPTEHFFCMGFNRFLVPIWIQFRDRSIRKLRQWSFFKQFYHDSYLDLTIKKYFYLASRINLYRINYPHCFFESSLFELLVQWDLAAYSPESGVPISCPGPPRWFVHNIHQLCFQCRKKVKPSVN